MTYEDPAMLNRVGASIGHDLCVRCFRCRTCGRSHNEIIDQLPDAIVIDCPGDASKVRHFCVLETRRMKELWDE